MAKEIIIRFEKNDVPDSIDVLFSASEMTEQVEELMKCVSEHGIRKFVVTDINDQNCIIHESEIISLSSDGRKVRIVTGDGLYTIRQTLQKMEKEISQKNFMRISRYEVVNVLKIQKFDFTIRGTLRIELEGGMETWASRRYIHSIKKHLLGKEETEI